METQLKERYRQRLSTHIGDGFYMLTPHGLNKKKGMLMRLAEPTDPELNAILQAAVTAINRLRQVRTPEATQSAGLEKTVSQR